MMNHVVLADCLAHDLLALLMLTLLGFVYCVLRQAFAGYILCRGLSNVNRLCVVCCAMII